LQALIHFFLELCLLRKGPQDLPGSNALVQALALVYLAVGVIVGVASEQGLWSALAQTLVDLGLLLGLLYLGLQWTRHSARFLQAGAALLGSGALLSLLVLVPLGMAPSGEDAELRGLGALLFMALLAWSILVTGHILRHTLDLTLVQGALIAVAYNLLAYMLLGALFTGA
jgi:hypothetical protein